MGDHDIRPMSRSPVSDTPVVAVVGAGAAGLLAALTAARAGAAVVLLESTEDGGRKILISGGGRCNILPSVEAYRRFVTDSSQNVLKKMLRSWPLRDQRHFFEKELGMPLVLEVDSGKLFPSSDRARDVRDRLAAGVREAGARIWFGARVTRVRPEGGEWIVSIEGAPPLHAAAVVLATGGLSVPATGSDGFGLAEADRMGHVVNPTYPALTPLTADPNPHRPLAGISLGVTVTSPASAEPGGGRAVETSGGFLFTHRGWSGPAVLDASHVTTRSVASGVRRELLVRWVDRAADDLDRALRDHSGSLVGLLAEWLPRRLAQLLVEEAGIPAETGAAHLRREDRRGLVEHLVRYSLPWTGDEGYRKAEVTGGGVGLGEVDPRTMESRRVPGLFLCGELLDAFGPIGGHNFMWAWATGRAAGAGAASLVAPSYE